jgi:hypothetical protein
VGLDKFAAGQMLNVHFPSADGRTLILSRHTVLNADQKLLVQSCPRNPHHGLPPPATSFARPPTPCREDFFASPLIPSALTAF